MTTERKAEIKALKALEKSLEKVYLEIGGERISGNVSLVLLQHLATIRAATREFIKGDYDRWEDRTNPLMKTKFIAGKILRALAVKSLTKGDLALMLKKPQSQISIYFKPNHAFNVRTLLEIESVLDIQLLNVNIDE